MTHSEHLAEAERIYVELAAREEDLEQANALLIAKAEAQAGEIEALKAEIVFLKARIKQLEDQLNPPMPTVPPTPPPTTQPTTPPPTVPPPGAALWLDDFLTAPSASRYILACHDPAANFVLASPGRLRVIFVAGKKDSSGKDILRSELIPRQPGTNLGRADPLGSRRRYEFAVTIPADYNPAVSSKPNEKRNLFQLHQISGQPPPIAVELIKPDSAPWNGSQNIIRLVVKGAVKWWFAVFPGNRYDVVLDVGIEHGTDGRVAARVNGVSQPNFSGPTAYDAEPRRVIQHAGLYLPGAVDDPAGGRTEVALHHLRVYEG